MKTKTTKIRLETEVVDFSGFVNVTQVKLMRVGMRKQNTLNLPK